MHGGDTRARCGCNLAFVSSGLDRRSRGFSSEELLRSVSLSAVELTDLTIVPILNWTIVTGDSRIDFRFFSAVRTGEVFSREVAVILADRIGGGESEVRKFEVISDLLD